MTIGCAHRTRADYGAQEGMVPGKGLEPPRCCHRQILSLVRLPVPSPGLLFLLCAAKAIQTLA